MRISKLFVMRKTSNQKKYIVSRLTLALLGLLLLSLASLAVFAQDSPNRGVKIGNAYAVGDFETVNLVNGNLMLNFPLGSLPGGRGEVGGGISLMYNSKLYDIKTEKAQDPRYFETYVDKTVVKQNYKGGWSYSGNFNLEFEDRRGNYRDSYGQPSLPACVNAYGVTAYKNTLTYVHKVRIVFPDGSTHEMVPYGHTDLLNDRFFKVRMDGGVEDCGGSVSYGARPIYYSVDGTYLRLETTSSNWTLYFPDGKKIVSSDFTGTGGTQRLYDRNDNYVDLSSTQATDQVGRTVTLSTNSAGDDEIKTKGVGGEELVWTVKWKQIAVFKNYQSCIANTTCPQDYWSSQLQISMRVVDRIIQPAQLGGGSYIFSYNAPSASPFPTQTTYGWGEISGVTLPSGAQVSYSYTMDGQDGPSGVDFTRDILKNYPTAKTLTYNKEYDGTSTQVTETWSYSVNSTSGTITSPDGSVTSQGFGSTEPDSSGYQDWKSGLSLKSVGADGTKTEKLWERNYPVGCSTGNSLCQNVNSNNPYVKTEFTSIKDAAGNYTQTAIRDYTYDKNGNVTQTAEYEFVPYSTVPRNQSGEVTGIPSGITPKRTAVTAYYADTPDAGTISTDGDMYIYSTSPKLKNAVKSSEVRNGSSQAFSRTEMFYDNLSTPTNGNLTQSKVWDSAKGNYSNPLTASNSISSSIAYNSYGMPTSTTDGNSNQTQITYGSVQTPNGYVTDLYPTQTVSAYGTAVAQTATAEYDFSTGLVKKTTALGNTAQENVVSETEYDALGRLKKAKAAVGTAQEVWTQTTYDDANRKIIVKSDLETKGDGRKVATQFYDQLGRVRLSKTLEDSAIQSATNETDGIKVQTRYLTGNPYSYQLTSNPYRANYSSNASAEQSMGWTQSKTKNDGKHSEVETFSGAALPTAFGGSNTSSTGKVQTDADANRTLVTDQAGKQRISKSNALGQLTDVWEVTASDASTIAVSFPNQTLSAGYQTSYSYDTLSNLTAVNQGTQQTNRTFSYSSLSRLKSASNPESGTIDYLYDANGNLTRKTDARAIQTNYSYDALNRVTLRDYSDSTPDVTYTYDNGTNAKGRLTKVSSTVSTTEYTGFDLLGRVLSHKQTTDGNAYTTAYSYNLSGALMEEIYPSTRVVRNVLNNNGDLSQVQSKKNVNAGFWNYAEHFTFTAAGAVSSMQLGNGKWESTVFNSRLQPTQIALGSTQNGIDKLKLNFDYGTTDNNGNVKGQTITVPTEVRNGTTYNGFTATQNYIYDSLNRLSQAGEGVAPVGGAYYNSWTQTFTYDRYGNRRFNTSNPNYTTTLPVGCSTAQCNPTIDTANNQFTTGQGYTYDMAGNLITDAQNRTFTYDAENKQTEVKNSSNQPVGTHSYDGDGKRVKKVAGTEVTIFVYDALGKLVAEYANQLASANDAKVSYLTSDHLGSPRINTDASGNVIARHDYQPFGEEIQRTSYGADSTRQKFTSYERDIESDLDFAEARYYNNRHGRFHSVDFANAGAEEFAPQSWNGYSYALNNPLNLTDPSGLIWLTIDGDNFEWVEDDYYNSEEGQAKYKDYTVSNGTVTLFNEAWGSYGNGQYDSLRGGYVTLNADGSLSAARDPNLDIIDDELSMLPVAAGTTLTFPLLAGGGAGATVETGAISFPIAGPIAATVLGAASIAWLWTEAPSMPSQPMRNNSSTSLANTSIPAFTATQNCACSVPVIQMAKGGKQNIRNHWNDAAVAAVGGGVAAQIQWLADRYKETTDSQVKQAIKTAQKAIGGRRSSGGGGK